MDWLSRFPPVAVVIISGLGLCLLFLLVLFHDAIVSCILIIPGHFILAWYMRIAKVTDVRKNFDARGEISALVGAGFWCVVGVIGFGIYRLS